MVSPRWATTVGEIDGYPQVVLRIQHPRLGPIDILLPGNDPIDLAAALEKTWERRDERRMGNMRAGTTKADAIQPPQSSRKSLWSRLVRSDRS
jgi:hypothetical protein